MAKSRLFIRVIKRVVLYLSVVIVCVLTATAYYFYQTSTSDEPASPFHASEMKDYVKSRITQDLSGFKIEQVEDDALILKLSKWRTRILVVCYRPHLDRKQLSEIVSLLISPEHSRKAPFDPPLEPGWCGAPSPPKDPGVNGFSAGCLETGSCEESVILDCAMNSLAGLLAGHRVLMDGRKLRWTDEDEFKEYFRSMRASFEYEKVDVYRYSRSIEDAGRSDLTRFDVVVAPNGEILGSAVYFMYMTGLQ
jgi:hypothetical protein